MKDTVVAAPWLQRVGHIISFTIAIDMGNGQFAFISTTKLRVSRIDTLSFFLPSHFFRNDLIEVDPLEIFEGLSFFKFKKKNTQSSARGLGVPRILLSPRGYKRRGALCLVQEYCPRLPMSFFSFEGYRSCNLGR